MPQWLSDVCTFLLVLLPGGLWMGFWFFAVNWKRVWQVLASGAWAACVLMILIASTVWAFIVSGPVDFFGLFRLPHFWGQLVSVSALAATALLAGWLQGYLGLVPAEVPLEGQPQEDDHAHH